MNTYDIEYHVTGRVHVTVQANSEDEASELAMKSYWQDDYDHVDLDINNVEINKA